MRIKKTFLAIIPAKEKSSRIKNKNILKFNGKSLVERTIEEAKKSKYLKYIYLSTDSKKIQSLAKKYDILKLNLRSKKFSGKLTTMHSVIKHEIKKIRLDYDYVIILQPTSPYRTFKDIDNACRKIIKNSDADCLVSCTKLPENYYPRKIMVRNKKYLNYLDLSSIFLNNLNLKTELKHKDNNFIKKYKNNFQLYFRNGAIYITKKNKIKRFIIGGRILSHEMHISKSLDINTYDDLKNINLV